MIDANASGWASSGVMSRNVTPGSGQSGMGRTHVSMSAATSPMSEPPAIRRERSTLQTSLACFSIALDAFSNSALSSFWNSVARPCSLATSTPSGILPSCSSAKSENFRPASLSAFSTDVMPLSRVVQSSLISLGASSASLWNVLKASSSCETSLDDSESNCVEADLRSLQ